MAAHVTVTGERRVAAPPAQALHYFTPEGERLYEPGWDPESLFPADGALVEGLVFRTRHGGEETLWLVSRCQPESGAMDYVRVVPGSRMGTVSVRLAAHGPGTRVTVTYALTALSPAGERALDAFAAQFGDMLRQWEAAIAALLPGS